jgi:hypothetical protein
VAVAVELVQFSKQLAQQVLVVEEQAQQQELEAVEPVEPAEEVAEEETAAQVAQAVLVRSSFAIQAHTHLQKLE